MALVTIAAANQTGTPVSLTQLMAPNGQIPGSTSVTLTDYNHVEEILRDDELLGFIQSNNLLLTVNLVNLTKEQSLAFLDAPTRPVKNNLGGASQAPTVTDDADAGYSVGSLWITTTAHEYLCIDDTSGAAVWHHLLGHTDSINDLADVDTTGAVQGAVLYYNGTHWVDLPPGNDGQILVTQGADANPVWANSTDAVRRFFSYSFTSSSGQPYIESTSVSYETIGFFEWPGSDEVDSLSALRVIVELGGGTSMDVRVYDSTNIATIAELTGVTDTTFTIRDLGTLGNISATDAIWEVQIKATGGGRKARLATLTGIF